MKARIHTLAAVVSSLILAACGGGGSSAPASPPPSPLPPPPPIAPAGPTASVDVGLKQLIFSWEAVPEATHYKLLENPDGSSGFTQVGDDIPAGTLSVIQPIAVHTHDFTNALYILEACNDVGCNSSTAVNAMNGMLDAIGYFKASNTETEDDIYFVAVSADGNTLAMSAIYEDSSAAGLNGDQTDNSAPGSGAVYVFRFDGTSWAQEAYIKASNPDGNLVDDGGFLVERGDMFGTVALSADGNTLVVGAQRESSNANGINGNQNDNSAVSAGAAYVFRFNGAAWSQQAYLKASNTDPGDSFGRRVALSADGNRLVVGAPSEDSNAIGIGGDETDNSAANSGAAYLFHFNGTDWSQEAYIKSSNSEAGDRFGEAVALTADGNTLAIGASNEGSNAVGVNGDQSDNSVDGAGAAYVFRFDGTNWSQDAFIKASNSGASDGFGNRIALSADGSTLAVSGWGEASAATGIDGNQNDDSAPFSGAAYVFRFDGTDWSQEAYLKASNAEADDYFGLSVALTANGNMLAIGAIREDGSVNLNVNSGAVYMFEFDGSNWSQQAYLKAPNAEEEDQLGHIVAISSDGSTLAVSAAGEDSVATEINGDQQDNNANSSGAVYVY